MLVVIIMVLEQCNIGSVLFLILFLFHMMNVSSHPIFFLVWVNNTIVNTDQGYQLIGSILYF